MNLPQRADIMRRTLLAYLAALILSVCQQSTGTPPSNGICNAGCLCNTTPESCPVGCYPTYTLQPDGSRAFSCMNGDVHKDGGPTDASDAG